VLLTSAAAVFFGAYDQVCTVSAIDTREAATTTTDWASVPRNICRGTSAAVQSIR
jgi:hypothetical protein